jgi:hypothetical protein
LPDATRIRIERTRELVRREAMLARECTECHAELDKRIWWICGKCLRQCTHEVHAVDRGRRVSGKDVEAVSEEK